MVLSKHTCPNLYEALSVIFSHMGDNNIYPQYDTSFYVRILYIHFIQSNVRKVYDLHQSLIIVRYCTFKKYKIISIIMLYVLMIYN